MHFVFQSFYLLVKIRHIQPILYHTKLVILFINFKFSGWISNISAPIILVQ